MKEGKEDTKKKNGYGTRSTDLDFIHPIPPSFYLLKIQS